MLRTKMSLAGLVLLACTIGCKKMPTAEEARVLLAGEWQLVLASNCNNLGIVSDKLLLHPDGKMEQHLRLSDGQHYNSATEHWQYVPDKRVELNERFNVSKAEGSGNRVTERRFEILLVEFTNPPTILLDPDKNCFYQRTRQRGAASSYDSAPED